MRDCLQTVMSDGRALELLLLIRHRMQVVRVLCLLWER